MVSKKALTFLTFEPGRLQSAIQSPSLLAMEAVDQFSQKGIDLLRCEPTILQTAVQWLKLAAMGCLDLNLFFHGHNLQPAPLTL